MDFRLYAQVLRRHKVLVIGGIVLALLLAELSVVKIGTNGSIKYRHSQLWSSTTRLAVGPVYVLPNVPDPALRAQKYALYATGDEVQRRMLLDGPINGKIVANAETDSNGNTQPFVDVTAIATSAHTSFVLANRAAKALQDFINEGQLAVAPALRVPVHADRRDSPVVFRPRSKTLPILIFLAVSCAFIALAFILENARERDLEMDEPGPDGRGHNGDRIEARPLSVESDGRPVGVEAKAAGRRRSA
jgi:hypothetical protein